MNRLAVTGLLAMYIAIPSFAQMDTTHPPTMPDGGGRMGGMASNQMMTRSMMRDMTRLMQQLSEGNAQMMRLMNREGTESADPARVREMARLMDRLGQAQQQMAEHMASGEMTDQQQQAMEREMQEIHNQLQALEGGNS